MKTAIPVFCLVFLSLSVPLLWAQEPAETATQEPVVEETLEDRGPESEIQKLERLAEQSFEEDDLDTAIALYRQLVDRLPDAESVRVLMTVAWLEHLSGNDAGSLTTLTEALLLMPNYQFRAELYSESFRDLFLEAQAQAVTERAKLANEAMRRGIERMRLRDYAAARSLFEEALGKTPDHPQALYNLALVNLYLNRQDEALAGFQKILALHSSRPDEITVAMRALSLTNLGFLYNLRESYQEAEDVLSRAVELDPRNQSAWSNLGVTRRRLGKKAPAAEAFRKAYELAPNDPAVLNNLALAYIDDKDWLSAVGLLSPATKRYSDNSSLWLNLGLAQLGMDNPAGAIESFEAAIRHDPDNSKGWASAAATHLARYYYSIQDYQRALQEADRTLAWRPDLTDGWIYRGLARKALGDLEGARRSFEEARRLDPTRAETHNNLGSVYFELRMLDQAEEAFRRALAIQPSFVNAQENLAAVRRARGQQQAGRAPMPGTASRPQRTTPRRTPPRLRPRLGLTFADTDYSALGLKGVMVETVEPGTAGSRADIRPNDFLLKVNGRDVANPEELRRLIYEQPDGATITVDLLRASRSERVYLKLK
ncbi:MAG: tetratricopeptide repeat protein [bacterium]|nr:tetratricopeptide repeat protein [bacterium]